ncbi:MAG TPA: lysine-sensitive aspartokinase 3 [Pyrinomonadaceae bacterium]|nr:lysine-sensitive aspartokinase 3 [Pyrinomonadaceae bacterium]
MFPKPTIMKFGGTSVEDARAFERVARIVRAHREREPSEALVVVVSAMSRVTDALLQSVQTSASGDVDDALRALEEHFARHKSVAEELLSEHARAGIFSALEDSRKEITEHLRALASHAAPRPALQDEVVSYGERLSATLLASVLKEGGVPARYVDARRLIITNDEHGCAAPIFEETERAMREGLGPLLERGETAVIGGFIGSCESEKTTTLGRGGSDYTAAIAGACLDAREIQIWTDVNGVLTADPRLVRGARTVERLSYAEAAELAYFGAKVLHPKTIQPAIDQCIPVRICNSRAPEETGTLVDEETATAPRTVKAIAHKTDVTVIQITAARMLGAYGFLSALFEVFDRHRTVVDVVTTSEVSVSLTLDDASALSSIIRDLRDLGTVLVEPRRATICVVGEGLRDTPGIAAHIFNTISDINVSLISLGASSINLTFVIDEARLGEAVTRLHAAFFDEPRLQISAQTKVLSTASDTSV